MAKSRLSIFAKKTLAWMFDWPLDTPVVGFKNETHGSWRFQQKIFCFRLFLCENCDNDIQK